MKYRFGFIVLLGMSCLAGADTFGTGANQFTIDFVPISGNTNPSSGYGVVNGDYRMGKFEITNDQWNKFKAAYGTVTGTPSTAYDYAPYWKGTNVPTNGTSWYEAAQFVNYLNTSTGHTAAYKFTGEQGTSNYTLGIWNSTDAWGGTNLYRHKDAFYFLPTEDEWVKAAYWNGTNLQTYAIKTGDTLFQGSGSNGGWNYDYNTIKHPWNVGSGSEELNGTFDMMGNIFEWMENPWMYGDYSVGIENDSDRCIRGGSYYEGNISSWSWGRFSPDLEYYDIGFRVASVPEPCTLLLLGLGGLLFRKR